MATEVILPKVDMDMATGIVSKWYVADGDQVKKGQAVFDIETDKAAMEIESPANGTIRIRETSTGTPIAIGTVVAMIFADGEKQDMALVPKPQVSVAVSSAVIPKAASSVSSASVVSALNGSAPRATPLARRLARQAGLSLVQIAGSGPHGRIVAADIGASKSALVMPAAVSAAQEAGLDVRPFDGMRRTIAQRLTQSKQTVPHFYLRATCTVDKLVEIRERLNVQLAKASGVKLSVNDFIIKAMALALQQVPEANVSYVDNGVQQHRASDVGVAVAIEGGLFTPVLRSAETKTLSQISTEMKDFAARARTRKLQPAEYQGGSASISNLGMFGVEGFTAIINPPQATILAIGATLNVSYRDQQPVLMKQMEVNLSCDHRVIDGAVGAKLLQAFKTLIEDPVLMLA